MNDIAIQAVDPDGGELARELEWTEPCSGLKSGPPKNRPGKMERRRGKKMCSGEADSVDVGTDENRGNHGMDTNESNANDGMLPAEPHELDSLA